MTGREAEPDEAMDEVLAAVARYGLPVDDAELAQLGRARDAMRVLAASIASVAAARDVEPVLAFSPGPREALTTQ